MGGNGLVCATQNQCSHEPLPQTRADQPPAPQEAHQEGEDLRRVSLPPRSKFSDPLYQILAWRDDIAPHPLPAPATCRSLAEPQICQADPSRWGSNLQGILMNIDWNATPMESFVLPLGLRSS